LQLAEFPEYVRGNGDGAQSAKVALIAAIDKICSCSNEGLSDHERNVQTHQHVNCMRNGSCRHHFPKFPMPSTDILEPLTASVLVGDSGVKIARNLYKITLLLKELWRRPKIHEFNMPFAAMLSHLEMTYTEYIDAIRSTLKGPTVFLRRRVCEIKMNTYCRALLKLLNCNMDIQFILDPYVVIEYICNYITKGPHGMSELMKKLLEEARSKNMNVSEFILKKANLFFNRREVCLHQAVCVVLGLPLRLCSRKFIYVPTCEPKDRVHIVKTKSKLEKMLPTEESVFCENVLERYSRRPDVYEEHFCIDFISKFNMFEAKGQTFVSKCKVPRVVRFRGYRERTDPENYFREQLLLYTSWRDESCLLAGHESYKAAYLAKKQQIDENFKMYNKLHASRIDQVMSQVDARMEQEEANAEPLVTSNVALEDVEHIQVKPIQFKSDVYKGLYDAPTLQPERDFQKSVRQLTPKQRAFYEHVKKGLQSPEQMLLFLTGGAGVGKSVVLRTIAQMAMRSLRVKLKLGGEEEDKPTILIMSYTGNASFNVNGNTVHSVLRLNPADREYRDLCASTLSTMKAKYGNVCLFILDEVSMISAEMFYIVHMRFCQLFGNDSWFGGLHGLVVGDLFQIKPIGGGWVFMKPNQNIAGSGAAFFDAWCKFKMYELTEVLRSSDIEWIECLNRLREGNHTLEDIAMVKARIVAFPSDLDDIICTLHEDLDEANKIFYDNFAGVPVCIKAIDRLSMQGIEFGVDGNHRRIIEDMHVKKKQFLQDELRLKYNLPVEIRHNYDTNDGLTNGAQGVLCGIERNTSGEVHKLHIKLNDAERGKKQRKKSGKDYISIMKVRKTFELKRKNTNLKVICIREQFAVGHCHARTLHRVQGLSLLRYGIILGSVANIQPHMVYVALSRGRKYLNIYLKDFDEKHIKVDKDVKEEMARLREHCRLNVVNDFARDVVDHTMYVVAHNARTFDILNYTCIPDFQNVDVLYCSEVRQQYVVQQYEKEGQIMTLAVSNFQKGKGQVMFVNDKWPIQHVEAITCRNVDMLFCTVETPLHTSLTIVGIYKHIKQSVTCVSKVLDIVYNNMPTRCTACHTLCIVGDFNIQAHSFQTDEHSKFGLTELALGIPTTIYGTKIDRLFVNGHSSAHVNTMVLHCEWSDHHMLVAKIPQRPQVPVASTIFPRWVLTEPHHWDVMCQMLPLLRVSGEHEFHIMCSRMKDFPNAFVETLPICSLQSQNWMLILSSCQICFVIWYNGEKCDSVQLVTNPQLVDNVESLSQRTFSACSKFIADKGYTLLPQNVCIHVPSSTLMYTTLYLVYCILQEIPFEYHEVSSNLLWAHQFKQLVL
jgi:hypothetical protein